MEHLSVISYQDDTLDEADWNALSKLSNLKTLKFPVFNKFGVQEAQRLPRALEKLSMAWWYDFKLTAQVMKAMPQTIKEWTPFPFYLAEQMAEHLPSSLELLDTDIALGVIPLLPQSMRHLKIDERSYSWDKNPLIHPTSDILRFQISRKNWLLTCPLSWNP
jgi:hypothetical protein